MIPAFLQALEQVFGWLLAASWQASVLALFVLLIQRTLGSRLNPRWRYALWLLVLVRLVLPVLPESALSLFQFAPPPPPALTVTVTEPLFVSQPIPTLPSVPADAPKPTRPITFYSLLAIIWLAGALTLLVLTWQVNRRFARQVANSPAITDHELLRLFAEAKAELGIRRAIRLIESGQVQSPAIMGLFQPTLLLPTDVRAKFNPRELRLIFLHELAHLKRGDVIAQALIALLQILHWFNPVLWFAFRRMRIDREPATDALVLSRTGEAEKEQYGLMLIKLLEHFNQRHSLPTLVGILEDKDQFKRRFNLIARFTRGAYGWSLLGVFLIAGLGIACLTKAKEVATAAPEYAHVQVLAIDLPESEYQADRQRIDDIVRNGYFISFLRLPQAREIVRSALGKTTFGHGAGLITSPSGPVLMFQITPTRDQDKIKIEGSVTFDRQDWSQDSGNVPNLNLRPVTTVPIASTLTPQHLQAVPLEGILEPDGVRPPRDNQPHRLFLFFTAWAENGTSTSVFSSLAALKTQMPVAQVPLPDPFVRSLASDIQVHDTTVTGKKEDKNDALLREAIADDDYTGAKKLVEVGVEVRDWNIADAMADKNARIVKLLWDHTTNRGSEIRYQISQGASVAQVAAMLKEGALAEPPEDVFIDPLGVAAADGDLPMIQLLLANGADPNWEGIWQGNKVERYTALGIAVGERRLDIITYLFDHGQKPSDFGAMIGALKDCTKSYPDDQRQISKQIVRLLVSHGALDLLPGNRGIYLYIACVEVADPELEKLLLDHRCNPEEVAIDGQGTAPVIQQVRDAVAGKNNKPPRLELKPILALLEAADTSAEKNTSNTVAPLADAPPPKETLAQLVLALNEKAKSIPADHQRLQILKGFYGADGSWRDVTGILQKSVQNNSLKVSWQQPYTEIGGDPAFLQVKTLVVSYRLDGVEKLANFREENPPVGLEATIPPMPASTSNAPADPAPPTGNALPDPQDASPKDTAASSASSKTTANGGSTPEQMEDHGSSGTSKILPLTLNFTLVEVSEKAYASQTEAMNKAVANGDLEFFQQQKDAFVGPVSKATYTTTKGWYSVGEVLSYIASGTSDKQGGKPVLTLQAKAVFLGINGDFVFSMSSNATSVDSTWQVTEPEKSTSLDVQAIAAANTLPKSFDVPEFHCATIKDKNWIIVPGKPHAFWWGKTLGQFTRTAGFRDFSHASMDEMANHKVPSRLAVFISVDTSNIPAYPKADPPPTTVLQLVDQDVDPDSTTTPLRKAIDANQVDKVKVLLDHGAVIGPDEMEEAVMYSAEPAQKQIAKLLWDHGPHYCSELAYAISQDAPVDQLEGMLDKGAPADSPEDHWISPLGVAAQKGNLAVARLLVQHGAELNPGFPHEAPLQRSAETENLAMTDFIVKGGARAGFGALQYAIVNPDHRPDADAPQIVAILIRAGATKSLLDYEAAHLLLVAADDGQLNILKQLLDAGLSPRGVGKPPDTEKPVLEIVRAEVAAGKQDLSPSLGLLEAADRSTGTTTPNASTNTLQADYANWLDHVPPPDLKEAVAKAFTGLDAFLSAMDSGSNAPAPSKFDGTMPTDESWPAYLDGVRTRFGEVQMRHLENVVYVSQPSVIYEVSVSYETIFRKGSASSTALELVRIARTPPTDPKGEWGEWKVTEFNIFEKGSTGQSSSPVAILSTETERTEAYFNDALEKDHTMIADSRVKSSTFAADAQMLLAIRKGDVDSLKKVLEHAVDPNTFDPDRFNSSPVYWAVYFDHPEALKMLLEHMAKSSSGPANESPLQLAQKAHPDLVPVLKEGIKHNSEILTTQLKAQLHSIHIDMPAFSNEPLQEIVSFLIKAMSTAGYLDRRVGVGNMDVPTSTTFTTPAATNISLWDAIQTIAAANKLRFDVDCVDGGDITFYPSKDEAMMHPAADTVTTPTVNPQKENPALDQALLDIARDGRTDKVGMGDADKVGQLLDQGAEANAKDERGTTALVWALNFGKDDAARLLIKAGADGRAQDTSGENAAWLAAKIYYCPGALEALLKKGVDVRGTNKQGQTILVAMMHVRAAQAGKMNYLNDRVWTADEFKAYEARERRVVELLIAAKADFNGKEGTTTPLMAAVQAGHAEAVRALLEHGADRSFKNADGHTALDLAKAFHPELAPLVDPFAEK